VGSGDRDYRYFGSTRFPKSFEDSTRKGNGKIADSLVALKPRPMNARTLVAVALQRYPM